jgi:hypothetical protein
MTTAVDHRSAHENARPLNRLGAEFPSEAEKKGHRITRIAVAFEAGHDGF